MKLFKILMIDDNPIDCLLMRDAMLSASNVVEFNQLLDGNMGSSFISESLETIDLLILDVNIPGKNGFELLSQIRKENSDCRLPVIMFSTSDLKQDVISSYEKGANAYLQKPAEHFEFVAIAHGIIQFWAKLGVLK